MLRNLIDEVRNRRILALAALACSSRWPCRCCS